MEGTFAKKMEGKGYGFIAIEGQDDLFVHTTDIAGGIDALNEGDRVSFDVADSPKGDGKKNAINVKKIG